MSDRFIPGGGSDGVRRGRGGSSRAGVSRVDQNNGTIEGTKGYKILADLENGRAEKNEGRPAHRGQQRPPGQDGTFLLRNRRATLRKTKEERKAAHAAAQATKDLAWKVRTCAKKKEKERELRGRKKVVAASATWERGV